MIVIASIAAAGLVAAVISSSPSNTSTHAELTPRESPPQVAFHISAQSRYKQPLILGYYDTAAIFPGQARIIELGGSWDSSDTRNDAPLEIVTSPGALYRAGAPGRVYRDAATHVEWWPDSSARQDTIVFILNGEDQKTIVETVLPYGQLDTSARKRADIYWRVAQIRSGFPVAVADAVNVLVALLDISDTRYAYDQISRIGGRYGTKINASPEVQKKFEETIATINQWLTDRAISDHIELEYVPIPERE